MPPVTPKKGPPDFLLFITVLLLLAVGVIMVLSASEYTTLINYQDSFYFFKRQLMWALLGLGAMWFTMRVDYWYWRRWAGWLIIGAFVLLILVLIPGVGVEAYGARRWLGIGSFTLQPSELAKFCVIIFCAFGLARQRHHITDFRRSVLPFLIVGGLASLLIVVQPDLGTAITLAGTVFIMLFVAGASLRALGCLAGLGAAAVALAVYLEPYRMRRLTAFLDPWKDAQDTGFQIIQSLYALGSGGLFGVGLGQGKQKFLYLPAQHTDFIFAVIGEELGFVGCSLVIILFGLFIWRGLRIAVAAPDAFASLLATGVTAGIALQAIINIGVVTGSMPVTGITLPFISFGGTSLLFTMAGVGALLNISKYAQAR